MKQQQLEDRIKELEAELSSYQVMGWVGSSMDTYVPGLYPTSSKVRKPPKVYRTEAVANKYGKARPVYVRIARDPK